MLRLPAQLFIVSFLFLWSTSVVSAQETPTGSLTVAPAYVDVTLTEPGETQDITLTYTNSGDKTLVLEMFPLDFAHTDGDGTIGLMHPEPGSYAYGLASYLSLQADQVTIEPKSSHTFTVQVQNRQDLSPGGHYGVVVGRILSPDGSAFGAQVAPSVSTLIYLSKIGGERYNLSLKEFDWGSDIVFSYPKTARLEFQNEGNIHVVPYGTITVTDMFGRITHNGILNTSSFRVMPQSRRFIHVEMKPVSFSLPISLNTITVRGTDSLKKTAFTSQTTSLSIHPIFAGILVLLVIALVYLRKKHKKRSNTKNVHK